MQIRIETSDPGASVTDCGALKRHFARGQVLAKLAEAGLAVLREPGPLRAVPVAGRDGFWLSISLFELTVAFNTVETDSEAYRVAAERVTGAGTVNGTIDVPIDVIKP